MTQDVEEQRTLHWVFVIAPQLSADADSWNGIPFETLSVAGVFDVDDFERLEASMRWLERSPPGIRQMGRYSDALNPLRIAPAAPALLEGSHSLSTTLEATPGGVRLSVVDTLGKGAGEALYEDIMLEHTDIQKLRALCGAKGAEPPADLPESLQRLMAHAQQTGSVGARDGTLLPPDGAVTKEPVTLSGAFFSQITEDEQDLPVDDRECLPNIEGLVWGTKAEAWLLVEHLASEISTSLESGGIEPLMRHRDKLHQQVAELSLSQAVTGAAESVAADGAVNDSPGLGL